MVGPPKVVLFVKKATEIVFASGGIVAPLKEYFTLQLCNAQAIKTKKNMYPIFFNYG